MPPDEPSSAPDAPASGEEGRLAELLELIAALAGGDFSRRASIAGDGSLLDGIGTGLNMLADELAERMARESEYQKHILHAARLAAVGRLAAGVAHEINNPAAFLLANLTVLQGHARSLAEILERVSSCLPAGSDARGSVERVIEDAGARSVIEDVLEIAEENIAGVRRISSIVRALLDFSHIETGQVAMSRLDVVADEACKLVAREIAGRARLVKRLDPVPAIAADHAKLVQVATNLLLNAAHAVPEGAIENNEIEVTTSSDSTHVVLQIRDTGIGVEPEIQDRLFEPFFTTKARGKGTGLGLSIAAEIIRGHSGEIRFRSAVGAGTTFEVILPLKTGLRITPVSSPDSVEEGLRRPRVLLIDDEPALLSAYQRMLGDDFDVAVAGGGREAIATFERDADWDAIVCDLLMPDLDGSGVLRWLELQRPALARKLGFCCAGAFTPRTMAFAQSMQGRYLAKPFERKDLDAFIRKLAAGSG